MQNFTNEFQLPPTRVRTIMKSTEDAANISQEASLMVTKATEMFISELAVKTFKNGKKGNLLKYDDLAEFVSEENKLEFLLQIIPKKMSIKEYLEMAAKDEHDSEESSSESEEE
uniref:Transcription factor CBF/NF-Y/archaeal histone domain-containing protein n=1 Tax=Megaselia scalaris TaxID=36166 RepID=T1H1Q8_MEGSC